MSAINLTDPIFTNEEAARAHFEKLRWPDGPVCPHCGVVNNATELKGKSHRPGLYKCHDCQKPFTATIGTVYERSHISLHKWLLATHLICASKKGISAHQLFRMLGFGSYRTAWFMAHRIRHAMTPDMAESGPLGGEGTAVSVDETYIGGKAKNRAFDKKPRRKAMVMTLVDHAAGRASSHHVAYVGADTVREILFTHVSRTSTLVSDESNLYRATGEHFAKHETVIHAGREYINKAGFSTNINENFFSLLKRGIYGVFHHVSPAHLHRYTTEFDFRYNTRTALGVNDTERAALAVKAVEGKRLLYRGTSSSHAH
jgi:transposase-like protein